MRTKIRDKRQFRLLEIATSAVTSSQWRKHAFRNWEHNNTNLTKTSKNVYLFYTFSSKIWRKGIILHKKRDSKMGDTFIWLNIIINYYLISHLKRRLIKMNLKREYEFFVCKRCNNFKRRLATNEKTGLLCNICYDEANTLLELNPKDVQTLNLVAIILDPLKNNPSKQTAILCV